MATPSLKEQLLAALEHMPDEVLAEILAYVQSLNASAIQNEEWQAYLAAEKEREKEWY